MNIPDTEEAMGLNPKKNNLSFAKKATMHLKV